MALLWIDGFDAYGTNTQDVTATMTSSGYVNAISGGDTYGTFHTSSDTRTGVGYSMYTGGLINYGGPERNFPMATSIVFGIAIKIMTEAYAPFLQIGYNNLAGTIGPQLTFYYNGEAGLSCITGDGDLVAATPPNVIFPGVWQYLECMYTPGAVAGSLQVKIDGAVVINVTSGKTQNAAYAGSVNSLAMMNPDAANPVRYDDLYICDQTGDAFNTYLGDCVVHAIFPDADAGPNAMAQTGGSVGHYTAVDEQAPDGDASYLSSSTSGQQEMFALSTFPNDIIDVLAMGVNVRARKETAGYANYEASVVVGGTEADGPAIPTNLNYETVQTLFPVPPGGGAWTTTIAQSAVIGFKLP